MLGGRATTNLRSSHFPETETNVYDLNGPLLKGAVSFFCVNDLKGAIEVRAVIEGTFAAFGRIKSEFKSNCRVTEGGVVSVTNYVESDQVRKRETVWNLDDGVFKWRSGVSSASGTQVEKSGEVEAAEELVNPLLIPFLVRASVVERSVPLAARVAMGSGSVYSVRFNETADSRQENWESLMIRLEIAPKDAVGNGNQSPDAGVSWADLLVRRADGLLLRATYKLPLGQVELTLRG